MRCVCLLFEGASRLVISLVSVLNVVLKLAYMFSLLTVFMLVLCWVEVEVCFMGWVETDVTLIF